MGGREGDNGAQAHLTVAEHASRGKAARREVPRRALGEWEAPPARADPIAILEEQDKTRVPELVPIRYGRMLVSPFAFFRGAAAIMAADLADGPRTGLHAQLCGDAHLSNFGIFAAPDRRLTFAVNDFDETLPGPFEWDIKRLVAGFAVAGRERGLGRRARSGVWAAVVSSYRGAMRDFASMRTLDLWYARLLGWLREKDADNEPRDFYVRQLWDQKGSAPVETMSPRLLEDYGRLCGWTLAKAHARRGDPVAIAAYLGKGDVFDKALAGFAETYADQNERDYAALDHAVKEGRVEAKTGL